MIDYDRDGWPDIYFTNAPTVSQALAKVVPRGALYHNNHDGTFADVTDKAGVATPCFAMGGAVGDYNNDGWPDMFVTCLGTNVLYRNNGDGTFTDVSKQAGLANTTSWSSGAAFGDYDQDGFVDLAVTAYVDFHLDDLPGFGIDSNLQVSRDRCAVRSARLEGRAGPSVPQQWRRDVHRRVESGGRRRPGRLLRAHAIWADFNNTGRVDLYVANDSTPNFLYKNDGNGKFSEIGLESGTAVSADGSEQGSMGVAVGDFNHTGWPSLYVTNFADEYNTLYVNQGKYDFRDASYEAGVALAALPWVKWGTAFFDLDNDGWLDLIAVNGQVYPQVNNLPSGARYRQPKNLFMNERNGKFCDAGKQAGPALIEPRVSRGLAVADFDNDGNIDVIVEDLDGAPMLLHNAGAPGTHWVSFEFAGTKSNRLAIGTKIKVVAGGMTQTEEVHSGGGYLSQHDLRVHFGVASAAKVDSVEIRWPSGKVETIKDLAANKFYAVLEGDGIVDRAKIVPAAKH